MGWRRRFPKRLIRFGYVELTYAIRNHLTYGSVANSSGQFIKADFASVTEAANAVADNMPDDFRVSITNAASPNAYPISSFTWMLIPSVITDDAQREAIISFIRWGLTKGQDLLEALDYARLPAPVIAKEEAAISRIKASGAAQTSADPRRSIYPRVSPVLAILVAH
jgi:phosphate transport system substrate-binding protein